MSDLKEDFKYLRDKIDKIDEKLDVTHTKLEKLTNGFIENKISEAIEKHLDKCRLDTKVKDELKIKKWQIWITALGTLIGGSGIGAVLGKLIK